MSATALNEDPRTCGLASALKERTRLLHVRAERSGIIADILKGRINRFGYGLLLRNLLFAYQQLEVALDHHRLDPRLLPVARPELYRSGALASDLAELCGDDWERLLPLLPAGDRYGRRIMTVAEHARAGLVAHAYARYLGDLSGGQVMKGILTRALGLKASCLAFYDFPLISDIKVFKADYRQAINRSAAEMADLDSVVEEGVVAFQLNIELSEAIRQAVAGPGNSAKTSLHRSRERR
jgi:heme oxygenase (biliverdin-producing, ferredoxin)